MAGKTFPAFPTHAQPAILRIWQEAHAPARTSTWRGETKKHYKTFGKLCGNMEPALMFPVRLARTNCWTNGPFADDLRHQTLMTSQQCYNYITSYGSPWITLFGHEWGDLPMTFTSEAAISENHCRIASRVTQKLLFKINRTISHSWHVIFTAGTVDYVFIYTETFFWPSIVMSPQLTRGVTKTRGTSTVTSYPSIVAHTNWRKVDIH